MYKLTTIEGYVLKLSEEEAALVLKAMNSGTKVITIQGNAIVASNITGVWREELTSAKDNKREVGVLHDGSMAIRKFGTWYALSNQSAKIDPAYYPEVAKDVVPSVEEWKEKYEGIEDREKVKALMIGESEETMRIGGMAKIGKI